ncbi:cryptochrome DASH [Dyadobacter flavalbus]|uniref:Cryptochrome DASH n=1 Tax=Dyadobacter flavalbus TaxID=2579942 RepID=A0A5M8R2T4_9BACT|nr:deoxyribodipyrimidine photo-lyase [Dyadobacter flavalbus]KAA6440492.1 cryptochrome DASH [Dyadobacter flavalbus]
MAQQRIIYWFRNDLRLQDNEALCSAVESAKEIVPVYVFDPRQFENTRFGFRRTGALRAQFLIDSVTDLRNNLQKKGGNLLVRIGDPEKIVSQLAEDYNAEYVYTSKEIAPQETNVESQLSKNLKLINIDIKLFWMDTLVHAVDLPFPISKLPADYAGFVSQIKDNLRVTEPFPEIGKITLPAQYDAGFIPTVSGLGINENEIPVSDDQSKISFGGETAALKVFDEFIKDYILNDKNPGTNDSITDSRISDWLSVGSISARYIYHHIKSAQADSLKIEATINNLLTRDYFHWTLLRYGPRLFKPSGIKHDFSKQWANDNDLYEKWINGQTDDEQVNAIMKKLISEGYLTLSEREHAASYLVNNWGVNWTWGAMYFESHLMDYEVSVNWGRWNNVAGVGVE